MCGRFRLTLSWQELTRLLGLGVPDPGYRPRWNIAPTQQVLALRLRDGAPELTPLRWGFAPSWAKRPLINARSEDAAAKRTWSGPLRRRRCLVPADGFYEWRREGRGRGASKQPFDFSAGPVTFAGLWDRFTVKDQRVECLTILTRAAGPEVAAVHKREPAVVPPEAREAWLDEGDCSDEARLGLLARPADFHFEVRPVGSQVNSARNEGPETLEYIEGGLSL